MTANHINFSPVNLGHGWEADEAWETGGPIVLIKAQSQKGKKIFKSRFDMQKAIFIDPMPIKKANNVVIRNLVLAVNAAFKKPRW
ncbi:MAG: hypothetical protein AAB069_03575 [Planctomycetota bacterium]